LFPRKKFGRETKKTKPNKKKGGGPPAVGKLG